jgi:hypothetical protein
MHANTNVSLTYSRPDHRESNRDHTIWYDGPRWGLKYTIDTKVDDDDMSETLCASTYRIV